MNVYLIEGDAMLTLKGSEILLCFIRTDKEMPSMYPIEHFHINKNVCLSVGLLCAHIRDKNLYNALFMQVKP